MSVQSFENKKYEGHLDFYFAFLFFSMSFTIESREILKIDCLQNYAKNVRSL